ncbi:CAP family protein [Streptomyces sp. NPDC088261]|uniref:CAP family protein n=1 Tax=Streptomyces sp. NPDC088261 TaxID=3365851 RepID=UPI00382BB240
MLKRKKIGVLLATAALVGVTAGATPPSQSVSSPSAADSRRPLPDTTDRAFLQQVVKAVNAYRARHGARPVRLDRKLNRYAKSRAREVSSHERLREAHRGLDRGYGENLYWTGSADPDHLPGPTAVKAWYDEVASYDFRAGEFSRATGHFTQLVWRGSKRIGAARATGRGGEWFENYVVVTFSPPGNVAGRFRENVRDERR